MQPICLIFIALVALWAPTPSRAPAAAPPRAAVVARGAAEPFQVGLASWYGAEFQGRETTSGERFDMDALTAAHRTLPFGTRVRVTNLSNLQSVVLRINDRGPVPAGRVIDLSWAAARALHAAADGLFPVRLDVLPKPSPPPVLLVWNGWNSAYKR